MSRRGRGRGGGTPLGWGGTSSSPLVGSNPWLVHPGAAVVEAEASSGRSGGGGGGGGARHRGGGGSGGGMSHHEKNGGAAVDLACTVCIYLGPLHCPQPAARAELLASLLACAATFGAVASHKAVDIPLSHRAPYFCDAAGGAWAKRACTRLDITFAFEEPALAARAGLRGRLTAQGSPHPPAVAAAFAGGAAAPRVTRPRLPGAASYAAPLLRPRELTEAFFAAGLLPWRLHPASGALEVLLGEEVRKGTATELSLLLGKREDAMDADAAACAAREADEEAAFVFGEAWRRRVAAVLRGDGEAAAAGAAAGAAGAVEAGQAPAASSGGSAGGGGGSEPAAPAAAARVEEREAAGPAGAAGEPAVEALAQGLGALSLAPGASGGGAAAVAAAPPPRPPHSVWLQDAKAAVFLLPIEEMLRGTGLTAQGLPQAHAEKRAAMTPAALAAGECSMHRLEWCPASTVLSDARVGAFAKSALKPALAALVALQRRAGRP
jgi:hypothetical protein